jgi:hypothetical protein
MQKESGKRLKVNTVFCALPGSMVKTISDLGSGTPSKNFSVFNPKIVSKLSEI